jgi:hypothetical protein
MTKQTSILNSDQRASNQKAELNLADLDAVSGGGRTSKAQSDLSAKWSQTLDSIAQNMR